LNWNQRENPIIGMMILLEKRQQIFGQVDSKNSMAFSLPAFEIYSINFLIKLDPT
jgi:hypothetical protein